MLAEKLGDAIDSYWARSKAFRFAVIAAFFLSVASAAFLTWYILRDYLFATFVMLLALLGFAYKKGYGKRR